MAKKRDPIAEHMRALRAIFPGLSREAEPKNVYEQLRAIEERAHRQAERECNTNVPEHVSEAVDKQILIELDQILGFKAAKVPVFLNGDPRGYAIKIHDSFVRDHRDIDIHRDWGGYGIIAPEF